MKIRAFDSARSLRVEYPEFSFRLLQVEIVGEWISVLREHTEFRFVRKGEPIGVGVLTPATASFLASLGW